MMEETLEFTAETGKLLNIVANALYSEKEVFVRELVSNASDACDKLRFEAISKPDLLKNHGGFAIYIFPDAPGNQLTFIDTGIGMNRKDIIENLGTIARSGTGKFLEKLAKNNEKAENNKQDLPDLIGQFGVGFYSALMVADSIELKTVKAGSNKVMRWFSKGDGKYTISEIGDKKDFGKDFDLPHPLTCGTIITLNLKKQADEYLESSRLNHIIRTYANHINVPVILQKDSGGAEQVNDSEALWLKPKSEITPENYEDFYHSETMLFDKSWVNMHFHAEGMLDYYGLLFIPSKRPFDLFYPEKISRIKLYVKRVFITDNCESLIPSWLRFVAGVIDASDIDLNISREMIQSSPVLTKIKNNIVKRVSNALKSKLAEDIDSYRDFFTEFGAVLKEGLCDPMESKKTEILPLILAYSLKEQKLISLDNYIDNMPDGQDKGPSNGQDNIYFLTGENIALMQQSPHLENAKTKGYDVLLLNDPVDEFWPNLIGTYRDKNFLSVQSSDDSDTEEEIKPEGDMQILLDRFTESLKENLQNVRLSHQLQASPVRLVVGKGNSPRLERLMRVHRAEQDNFNERILEINPNHALIKALAQKTQSQETIQDVDDAIYLLYEQARMIDGDAPADIANFSQKLNRLMEKSYL
ncbi:MAG: molecular chaperone HtpG [Alphaproteobacteria bacterium]|nr:molecular chaperone HtpG [Alphaproteobacteria bacterium]